jgi:plastocyanin
MQDSNATPNNVPVVNPPRKTHTPGKWLVAAVILLMIGVASVLLIHNKAKQGVQAEPVATVQITGSSFVPETIKVKQGDSVTWVNTDSAPHQVAADPFSTHSKLPSLVTEQSLTQNESFTFTFDKQGTYTYHDPLNPTVLKGTVIVE